MVRDEAIEYEEVDCLPKKTIPASAGKHLTPDAQCTYSISFNNSSSQASRMVALFSTNRTESTSPSITQAGMVFQE